MKKLYNQVKRDQWAEAEVTMPIIARYGTGGGNIPIVIEPIVFRDDITIKIDGGALPLPLERETTKECNV